MEKFETNNKKENILVWLDFDAYSYVNFGIVIELAKLDKYDFIGVVTTKQDMSFFENQEILPFKKIIYYPNCYINKKNYNIKNLKNFEKKFSLNLWMDIFSERSFYKYWTDFHKFSKEEIYSIVENSISFFINILNEYKPKLVLTQHIGENISNLLLYKIAKNLNFRTLMPVPVHMHNKIVMSDNLTGKEISNEYKKLIKEFSHPLKDYDEKFIKKQSFFETINLQFSYSNTNRNLFQKFNHYIKRISNDPEPIYKNVGKTKLNIIKFKIKSHFEIKKREKFLDKNSEKSIKNEKFLYFPLQSEPEAKSLTTTPFYVNQITLIENIAKSIPIDYVLYVKEHPIQKIKMWRSIEDYKNIIKIPNVKLIHPNIDSQKLISKSQGLISVLGSTGFETLFYKKPVILFAEDYYDNVSMVTKINSFLELNEKIKNALNNYQFNNKEMNVLIQAFENQTISVPYFSILKDGIVISSIQRIENDFNLTIKYFEKYFENHKQHFKLIANTIYSKI
mgnify:CR=1 FL=1|jgi:hypothetical protein|tara:strand:+ start:294 stop:1814 length:1521 start_codon:yes stop_codon:yes gene_type:complete